MSFCGCRFARNVFDKIGTNQYQTASASEVVIIYFVGHDRTEAYKAAQFDNAPDIRDSLMKIYDHRLAASDRRIRHAQ